MYAAFLLHLQISKNTHVLNLHITWTDLSLKKCLLPVILILLLIRCSLGQIMLQGCRQSKFSSGLSSMQLKVLPTWDQSLFFQITCTPNPGYWFSYFQKDIYAIEMVQRREVRFLFNDYSYNNSVTSLLNTLNWPTLQNRRINLRAIMLHKIIKNLIGIPVDSLFA